MKFVDFRHIFSSARTNRYLFACGGDKRKSVLLYKYNIQLCQRFYGVLNIFEVILRNAINEHYIQYFNDADWIVHQAMKGNLLENNIDEVVDAEKTFKQSAIYSSDRMASAFTFGFWTYMFSKKKYKLGDKTLLRIFPNRVTGTTQKAVYNDLTRIREFRNRIAHHEPIVFGNNGTISTSYAISIYKTIIQYIDYMGYDSEYILELTERPDALLSKIENC